jgi:hypothetical protein
MFVGMPWGNGRTPAVPLSQVRVSRADGDTRQAVEDRHYWVARGNER